MKVSKIPLSPTATFNIDLFEAQLKKAKGAKKKFFKLNQDGYFSYAENKFISPEEVSMLIEIVGDRESIYKYFNTEYSAFNIKIKESFQETEEVESRNIYALMAAKTITHYEGSFDVKVQVGKPPITVIRRFYKDTTLSMREINNFM